MKGNELEIKQLRKRFVEDYSLPIQVVNEEYFTKRIDLFEEEFGARTKYENLCKLIDERFNGSPSKFLAECKSVCDRIIGSVTNSDAYKEFMNLDLKQFKTDPIASNRNLYTQEQDGGMFVSFDMRKANYATLKYVNPAIVYDSGSYEEFIGKFTDLDYIKESKFTRQVIFGKLQPKRISEIEKFLTNAFAKWVAYFLSDRFEPFSLNCDEIIFKFKGTEDEFERFKLPDIDLKNFRYNKFKLNSRVFSLATSDSSLVVYEKEDYLKAHKTSLYCVPATYYPQVYKLLHGLEIEDYDLIFYYNHELCKFLNQLKLVK